MQKLQAFAWQSTQRGNTLHVAANPTAGELLHKEYLQKKDVLKTTSKTSILEKYGGEQYLDRLPKELLSGQSEQCEFESPRNRSQLTSRCRVLPNRRTHQGSRQGKGPIEIRRGWYVFHLNCSAMLIVSPAQQPQGSLGVLVRPRICSMGFRMLSFHQ